MKKNIISLDSLISIIIKRKVNPKTNNKLSLIFFKISFIEFTIESSFQ